MPHFVLTWLVTAVALLITSHFVPGFEVRGFITAVIAAVVLGLVNAIVRPILIFFTLPLTILTLGLFLFVVNALSIWIVAALLSPEFQITGFIPALVGSIVLTIVTSILNWFVRRVD